MATFGWGTYKRPAPVKQEIAASDPESLIEDMQSRAEEYATDRIYPEWDARIDESKLPSNRFGGLEPE